MPTIEVSLPDRLESEVTRLVEQGEFINREQAVEDLLSRGVSAYETTTDTETSDLEEEIFGQANNERQDPARQEDADDGYTL
jgi:Arc/MetJ-type ribon-helix-helix transcriptional regulator